MGNYLVVGICGLIGGLALLTALKMIVENYIFIRAANKASATVISFAMARNSDGHTMYLPVLEFKTSEGRRVCFNSTVASNPPAYQIGDRVEIYFLAKNPQAAKISSIFEIWLTPLIFLVVGGACFTGAVLAFWAK